MTTARSRLAALALSSVLTVFAATDASARRAPAPAETNAVIDVPAVSNTLRRSRDATERVAAARLLASSSDSRALRALERALRDRDLNVRAAAAQSLAQNGDSRSLRALQRVRREASPMVRAQIGHAIAALSEESTARAKMRIGEVTIADGITAPAAALPVIAANVTRVVSTIPRLEMHNTEPLQAADRVAAGDHATYLRIDPTITAFTVTEEGGNITVSVELQLVLSDDPGLTLRAVERTSGGARVNRHGDRDAQIRSLLDAVLRAEIDGAVANLDGAIQAATEPR